MNEGLGLIFEGIKDAIGLAIGANAKEKQMEKQFQLNEEGAANAAKRQMEMYRQQYEMNTPLAMRRNLEKAGLSVGLMYGGKAGSSQGIAAGTTAASTSQGSGIENPLGISIMNASQLRLNNAQEKLIKAEAEKTKAEENKINTEASKTNEETNIIKQTAKYIISEANSSATLKFFERVGEEMKWNNNFKNENEMHIVKDEILNKTFYFQTGSIKGQEILLNVAKTSAEIAKNEGEKEYYEAMEKLTSEKAKYYFAELCISAFNAQTTRENVEAQARKIALETGDETNWMTWVNLSLRVVESGIDAANVFTNIKKYKEIVKNINKK